MKVKATKSFRYNGKNILPGQTFDTKSELHAKLLVGARKVEYAQNLKSRQAPSKFRTQQTKDISRPEEASSVTPDEPRDTVVTEAEAAPNVDDEEKNDNKVEELESLTNRELKELAEKEGATLKPGMRKSQLVGAITTARYGRRDMRPED